jgi:hypothetical protein
MKKMIGSKSLTYYPIINKKKAGKRPVISEKHGMGGSQGQNSRVVYLLALNYLHLWTSIFILYTS